MEKRGNPKKWGFPRFIFWFTQQKRCSRL